RREHRHPNQPPSPRRSRLPGDRRLTAERPNTLNARQCEISGLVEIRLSGARPSLRRWSFGYSGAASLPYVGGSRAAVIGSPCPAPLLEGAAGFAAGLPELVAGLGGASAEHTL